MNINKLIYWGATLWTVGTFGAGYLFYTTRNDYVEFKKQHHEQLTNQEALKAHDIHTTAQYTIGRLDKLISGDTKIGRFYLSTIEESINVRSEEQIVQQYLAVRKNFEDLRANLPEELRMLMVELSPSNGIENLKAKVFILNDKKDTFVPKNEGERLAGSLPRGQVDFIEVDSFEHVNPATRLERWAAIRQLWYLGRYVYKVISVAN